ncbi:hypothetical protein JHK87_006997 [Glycine soja]|nr:hypothetical protein JHK87_006997 [Glycine soja]
MRWNSQVVFSRPIDWILALHGDVVPFMFAGGDELLGVETEFVDVVPCILLEFPSHLTTSFSRYFWQDRKKIIFEQSNALAESVNGQILIPKGLLDEVVNLVEAPFPVLGKFKETFLDLLKDLLTMVANGAIDETTVRKGNEAVLWARYEDAKFFYEMDNCKRFSEFRKQLKNILFHEKLGTMLDKMTRVENMVTKLSCLLDINEDVQQIIRDASSLAMSVLATAVVTEFTSLSGIMGRHYALRDGYSDQIAEALLEITLPRFSGDILPKSDADIVLAIADR